MNEPGTVPAAETAVDLPWYKTITRDQWHALIAAKLGWMLDAMDFVLYLMAITTLQREFDFGTETAGILTTVALLTSAVGGLLFGIVADKIGRTRALMATILIFSLCSLGTATAQDLAQLIVWRALLGLGMGGEWSSGAVLVSETWPAQHRAKAIGIMQSGWALGYILAAVVAAIVLPTLGWRWLFAVGVLPALLVFWVRREVHEPAVWTAEKKENHASGNILDLFRPNLLWRTVSATLLTSAIMFAYWGLFSWMPAFLESPVEKGGAGMNLRTALWWIILTQLGAFAGYLSFGFIGDAIGRRLAFVLYLVAAAVVVPIYGQMGSNATLLMVLSPVLGFVGHGYFSLFGVMLAELFPTRVRATGQGFTYNAGRAMGALAPFVIGVLAESQGIGPALALTSAFYLLGAVLVMIVPRPEPESTIL